MIDPSSCSFRSCNQLANSFPSLLLKHLPGLPPPASSPSIFGLLVNSLEAVLIAAEVQRSAECSSGFLKHLPQCHLETLVNDRPTTSTRSGLIHRFSSTALITAPDFRAFLNLFGMSASHTGEEAPRGQAVSACVGSLLTFGSPAFSSGCVTLQASQYLLDAECKSL